jgi:hypothetical protein
VSLEAAVGHGITFVVTAGELNDGLEVLFFLALPLDHLPFILFFF